MAGTAKRWAGIVGPSVSAVLLLGEVPFDEFVEEDFLGGGDGAADGGFGAERLERGGGSGEALGQFFVAIGAPAAVERGAQGDGDAGGEREGDGQEGEREGEEPGDGSRVWLIDGHWVGQVEEACLVEELGGNDVEL